MKKNTQKTKDWAK